jgi:hypothetical protein
LTKVDIFSSDAGVGTLPSFVMTFGGVSSADIFKTMENKSLFAKVINTVTNERQKQLSKRQ